MDERRKRAAKEADEILKKFADSVAKVYNEEAETLMRQAEAEGIPDIQLRLKKPSRMPKRVLRIAALFLVVVFIGSIVIPVPEASAWRVWWLDFIIGENSEDVDINGDDDFKYYVSELPEGFVFEKEIKKHNRLLIVYANECGESIMFTQIKGDVSENSIDNAHTKYSKEMIGDFEVMVGHNKRKIEFEFTGEDVIMAVNTDASYEVGKKFIEKIKEFK